MCVCVCVSIDQRMKLREMLPPPGGDVEPVEVGASGSMPVCTVSNWLDKTAPLARPPKGRKRGHRKDKTKQQIFLSSREAPEVLNLP